MTIGGILQWPIIVILLAGSLGSSCSVNAADARFSGVVEYSFEPNPKEIKPKMYNWEIKLNGADSRNGTYDIAQITRPKTSDPTADAITTVLVDSVIVVPNQDGIIDFNLYVGDKEPKQNMRRRGNVGQPIIFSGIGTAKAESSWIVLPAAKVDEVVPSGKGTPLSNGRLSLIQFTVTNEVGARFQADVMLRRK